MFNRFLDNQGPVIIIAGFACQVATAQYSWHVGKRNKGDGSDLSNIAEDCVKLGEVILQISRCATDDIIKIVDMIQANVLWIECSHLLIDRLETQAYDSPPEQIYARVWVKNEDCSSINLDVAGYQLL